jgi:hypothetical protein
MLMGKQNTSYGQSSSPLLTETRENFLSKRGEELFLAILAFQQETVASAGPMTAADHAGDRMSHRSWYVSTGRIADSSN